VPDSFLQDKYTLMSYLFDKLNPFLGLKTPTFLQKWPAFMTTSAPLSKEDPSVAERSELYIAGLEIADGFPFLTDLSLQKKLFDNEQNQRIAIGKPKVQLDEQFLKALSLDMPQGAGMALGVDRLVSVLLGANSLAEVQAFSSDEL
jgi:lysyl-tRNA synthetase class 2